MKKVFQEFCGPVLAVIVVVALISVTCLFFQGDGSGWIDGAFKGTTEQFVGAAGDAIDGIKVPATGNDGDAPLYSFGVLSDIHLKDGAFGRDEADSVNDYKRALTFYKSQNVEFVSVVGDIVANNRSSSGDVVEAQNEWVAELRMFKECNTSCFSGKPVYSVVGNHDATPNGYYAQVNNSNKNTEGLNIKIVADGYDGTESAEVVYKEITGQDLNYVVEYREDVYIYSSMYYWYYAKFNRDEDVEWLETQLEKYSDRRVFLFFHLPLNDTFEFSGGSTNGFYGAPNGFASNYLMKQLIEKYKNVIWFSGHTHYDFSLNSSYGDDVNIYQSGDSMTMIHCASCSHPRIPNGNSYTNVDEGSQGYLVDVYDDRIVVKGVDFTLIDELGNYEPIVEYTIFTSNY